MMHIPSGASQTVEILSFREAMRAAPKEPYDESSGSMCRRFTMNTATFSAPAAKIP